MFGSTPPPPCRSPPLVVPWGGGGPSLGQPKIFRCGSLCCCVGDCVVGHCHLYPLYSWQDILLTFAKMELDSTTMSPPGTNVMFIRSTGEPVLAQLFGHSEHIAASLLTMMARPSCTTVRLFGTSQMCVYGGGAVPQGGGWGTVTWQPSPRGWSSSLGWGTTRWGGVRNFVPAIGCLMIAHGTTSKTVGLHSMHGIAAQSHLFGQMPLHTMTKAAVFLPL